MLSPVSLTIGAVLIHFFINNMDTFPFCPWYVGGPVCSVVVPPVTVSPIVDTENVKIGKVIESESIHRMKIYTGLDKETKDEPLVGLNWQPCSSRDNVRVDASPVIGSFWQAVRAVTNIKADKFDILNLVIDDSRIAEFDDMFDFSQPIAKVSDKTVVRRMCFKPVWPTAPRDFLCCTTWLQLEDGSIIVCSRSVPDKILEVEDGYVRGTIDMSGYWIQPYHTLPKDDPYYNDDPTVVGCKVTLTAHTDLGGTMPAWIINMLSAEAPLKILIKIREIFEKGNGSPRDQ